MFNTEGQREIVVKGMREHLKLPVVRTNQTAEMPAFPFLGYNITTLASENNGTYGEYEDGKARKPILQTYSFTAHSDKYEEAVTIANEARSWLDYIGMQYLNDNDVVVQSVGNVTDRSNLLTAEYIYSYGFDCEFWMYDEISLTDIDNGEINGAVITEKIES